MVLFNKGIFEKLKQRAVETKEKISDNIDDMDVSDMTNRTKQTLSDAIDKMDIAEKTSKAKSYTAIAAKNTSRLSQGAYAKTKSSIEDTYQSVEDIDWSKITDSEFRKNKFSEYYELSRNEVSSYFHSTFEVDKETAEMVSGIKNNLPVPASSVDDIFDQCKREAIRRATAAFFLAGTGKDIDDHSADKYENLSESYKNFSDKQGHRVFDDPNFAHMKDVRHVAANSWSKVDNGYNSNDPLYATDADIEHVLSRKEMYNNNLLKAGTTNDEIIKVINSAENLVFADASLNRSLQDTNIYEYLDKRGKVHADNSDLVDVEIKGRTVTVSKKSINKSVSKAEESRSKHQVEAAKEVGLTIAKTGASMAVQQVVGLIVVETIDIFIEEIRDFVKNFKLFNNEDGLKNNSKQLIIRIQTKLNTRFEERQIWAKAKELGIEAGVSGALSVIPQIIISMLLKMPSFILALIREGTLSMVRCVRIMASNDENKLNSIGIIMAGAASAVVGLYLGRVISTSLAGVPLLNKFNSQITSILSGLLVTAIPLTAIYAFDQNKSKLSFSFRREPEALAD